MKIILGLILCYVIGAACRFFSVPVPAPPALVGALLVVAMTAGYSLADRFLVKRPSSTEHLCGGPTGATRAAAEKEEGKSHG